MVTSKGRSFRVTSAIRTSGYGSLSQSWSTLCQTGQKTRDRTGTPGGQDYSVTGDMAWTAVMACRDREITHVSSW